jgi:hypothetical protein
LTDGVPQFARARNLNRDRPGISRSLNIAVAIADDVTARRIDAERAGRI